MFYVGMLTEVEKFNNYTDKVMQKKYPKRMNLFFVWVILM